MPRVTDQRALWIALNVLPHEPSLRARLARQNLPGGLEPDDVVQEAYGRFAAMDSVDHVHNPKAYFFGIARTTILMHLRRTRVVSIRALEEDNDALQIASDDPSPEIQASDRQQLRLLAQAIDGLPEPGRRAFLMRVVEELTHREIGDRLGMSENAVQKSLTKSLNRMIELLGRGGIRASGASGNKEQAARVRNGEKVDQRGN